MKRESKEVEEKRDGVVRLRGGRERLEEGKKKGGQSRREEELSRASTAVNILQAWIRGVMK